MIRKYRDVYKLFAIAADEVPPEYFTTHQSADPATKQRVVTQAASRRTTRNAKRLKHARASGQVSVPFAIDMREVLELQKQANKLLTLDQQYLDRAALIPEHDRDA